MITVSSVAVILVLLFIFKKAISHSTKRLPDLALKAVVTTDVAMTAGFNTVLLEVNDVTVDQAEKLGMDSTSTPDQIFERLSGVKLGEYGKKNS